MRSWLKWIGIVLGVIVGLLLIAVVVVSAMGASRLAKTHDIELEEIVLPTDEDSLARGGYLAQLICTECHGVDLSGEGFIEEDGIATVYSANLTPGEGGISDQTDAEVLRAIRHGVDHEGRQLVVMPAEIFIHWSEEDLAATIAYLRTLPPVDAVHPEPELGLMGRILMGADMFGAIFPAEYIDHNLPYPDMPEVSANPAYGAYLSRAVACTLCHGPELAGESEPPPNMPPDMEFPGAPNLTSAGELATWTEEEFMTAVRTGVTPSGRELNEIMAFELYAKLSDTDLKALWAYVQSLP